MSCKYKERSKKKESETKRIRIRLPSLPQWNWNCFRHGSDVLNHTSSYLVLPQLDQAVEEFELLDREMIQYVYVNKKSTTDDLGG